MSTVTVVEGYQSTVTAVVQQTPSTVITVQTLGPKGDSGEFPTSGSYSFTGSFSISGSFNLNDGGILDDFTFNSYTSSIDSTLSNLESESGSIRTDFNSFTSSYNTGSFTGSFTGDGSGLMNLPVQEVDISTLTTTSSFNSFTSSYLTDSASFDSRIIAATNEQNLSGYLSASIFNDLSGSFATTGSNTFVGNQTVSGSIIFDSGLIITASNLYRIGDFTLTISGSDGDYSWTFEEGGDTPSIKGPNFSSIYSEEYIQISKTNESGSSTFRAFSENADISVSDDNGGTFLVVTKDGVAINSFGDGNDDLTVNGSIIGSILATNSVVSSSQQIADFGFITSSQIIETGSFATTGSNTFVGNQIVSGTLNIATNSGDEGGEIQLGLAQTNTILSGSIVFDVYTDKLRLFEGGGNNRGAFLNVASQSNNVSSEIVTSTTVSKIETISSASYAALNPPISGTLYIII
jgi:hypothetical protein